MRFFSVTAHTPLFFALTVFLCLQFAVYAPSAHNAWFYGAMVPALAYWLFAERRQAAQLLSHPAMRLNLIFFLFIIAHALLLADAHPGAGKVSRNTLATFLFVWATAGFFAFGAEAQRRKLLLAVGLASGLCAAISLFHYLVFPPSDPRMVPLGRADTQVLAAFVYTAGAIFGLAALRFYTHPTHRGLLCASIFLCFATVLLTQSRMALFILALCLAIGGIFLARGNLKVLFISGTAILATMVLTLTFMLEQSPLAYLHSMLERGDSYRLELWQLAWEKIRAHPWIGNGMLSRVEHRIAFSPHNIYLNTAMALGIPGLVLLLAGLGYCIAALPRLCQRTPDYAFLIILLLMNGLGSGLIDHSRIVKGPSPLWIIFWLPVAVCLGEMVRQRAELRQR